MGLLLWGKKLSDDRPMRRQEGCMYAVRILAFVNLLNYADRNIINAVKSQVIHDMHLSDFESTLPQTGMTLAFMISAALFGHMAVIHAYDRRIVLFGGVLFWSLATGAAGLSGNLIELIVFRSLVGVGEAAYGIIAPPMLFDFFPKQDRTVVYGSYFLNSILGAACGFIFGSVLASRFGWRWTSFAFGLPGTIVAISMLRLNDPVKGVNDIEETESLVVPPKEEVVPALHETHPDNTLVILSDLTPAPLTDVSLRKSVDLEVGITSPSNHILGAPDPGWNPSSGLGPNDSPPDEPFSAVREVISNRTFQCCVLGLAANNFAFGGLTDWMMIYLQRYVGASLSQAGIVVGAGTLIAGICGTLVGSITCKHYDARVKNAYLLIPALACIPATVAMFVIVNSSSKAVCFTALFCFLLSVFCVFGPIVTLLMTSIPPARRSLAVGITIFVQHIFG
jgi:MFS family permease